MARKDDNIIEREKGGSRLVTVLIALAIIAIWLVVFACLIKFDVGGIGSNVLYPVLKDVPVINRILPVPSEEEQAREGNYQYNTLKAANARIRELENQLASQDSTTTANSDYIADLEAQVRRLQRYKDSEDAFNKRVQAFDEKVVFNEKAPDISEYRSYYEEISPENAEKIYRQVLDKMRYSEQAEKLATIYSNEDPAYAAKILSEMTENLELVCDILENMSEKKAAAILQEMDSVYAAQITKKISAVND
ncbi:MAG: hypothetical protein J5979_03040 [Lachnospiraceae bacterium]|nr:hypothetical protein [Lachnospiraceae bacterium]